MRRSLIRAGCRSRRDIATVCRARLSGSMQPRRKPQPRTGGAIRLTRIGRAATIVVPIYGRVGRSRSAVSNPIASVSMIPLAMSWNGFKTVTIPSILGRLRMAVPGRRGIVISGLSVEERIPVLLLHCGPANAIAIERIRATRISVFVWCASRNLCQPLVKYDLCYLKSSLAKLSTYANGIRCIRSPPPSLVGGGRFV